MRMTAYRPSAVAAAFSNSCRPVLLGESCWPAIPDPITSGEERGSEQLGEQPAG
jgi:hypothetical protein